MQTEGCDLFQINNDTGPDLSNIGGVSFQDLQIFYATGLAAGAAIRVLAGQNIRLFRMTFVDCPVAAALDNSLQVSIIDSVVWYSTNTGTAVTLGKSESGSSANETYIAGCVFEAGSNSIGTGTGLLITQADEVRVVNTRIEAFQQGIVIAPSLAKVFHSYFENVSVFTTTTTPSSTIGAGLLIQPTGTAVVAFAVFVGCQFGPSVAVVTKYTGPGVLVDQSQTSGLIDQVRFASCWSSGWGGNGLQLNASSTSPALTNVEILGGYYSCNGTSDPDSLTGIAISNAVSGARIVGTACNNSVYDYSGNDFLPKTQGYGVSIASGATNIFVRHCDLTGNKTAALLVTSPGTAVEVTDCAGYNDQGIQVQLPATAPPPSGLEFFNNTLAVGYYGPVSCWVWSGGVSQITISGVPTGVTSGAFDLAPGEGATLTYPHASPPKFAAIGK